MAERCPTCNAEFGPDDAYCTECGTPRRKRADSGGAAVSDAAGWPDPPVEADRANEPLAPPLPSPSSPSTDEDDFIPLVIPPSQRDGGRDRRTVAAILIGVLLIGALAAAAWFVFGVNDGDDDNGETLGRRDVPAWVVGGSPGASTPTTARGTAATPNAGVVVDNNVAMAEPSATQSLMVSGSPQTNGSPTSVASSPASSPARRDVALSGTATASPGAGVTETSASSVTSPVSVAATPTVIPTVAATPTRVSAPTPAVTVTPAAQPTATVPAVSVNVMSSSAADSLSTIVAGIDPPATSTAVASPLVATATPTRSVATSTPGAPPAGDGTGGPKSST